MFRPEGAFTLRTQEPAMPEIAPTAAAAPPKSPPIPRLRCTNCGHICSPPVARGGPACPECGNQGMRPA